MNGWHYYQTPTLAVVPYMPGTPVYRDGALSLLYYRTRDEGKLAVTFCGDVMNHDQFIAFFEKRKTMQVLCEVEDDKTLKPVGYSWVDMPRGVDGARAAMCAFCFFNGASERHSARDLGRLGIAYWFMDLQIDVLHGVMLEANIAGRNFAQKLGFTEAAIVPDYHFYEGELVPARVMILRKRDFVPTFEEWFPQQFPIEQPA